MINTNPKTNKLIHQISSGSASTAIEAAKAIIEIKTRDFTPQLVAIMNTSTGVHNKEASAFALSWLDKDNEALDALINVLTSVDMDESVRGQAAEGISYHKPRKNRRLRAKANIAILEGLKDKSPVVRFWSCFAAGHIKLLEALPILEKIKRSDKSVNPGWWYVSEEAEDAIEWIHGRAGKNRIPLNDRKTLNKLNATEQKRPHRRGIKLV